MKAAVFHKSGQITGQVIHVNGGKVVNTDKLKYKYLWKTIRKQP
jgi:hypothetical protein